jgi:phosphotransacetylase
MEKTPIHSSDQLIEYAISIAEAGRKKIVAVAAAQDVDVIDAVIQSYNDGFVEPILIGDGDKIRQLSDKNENDISNIQFIDEPDVTKAAHQAAALAAEGHADAIMKGFIPTSALLKVILDKEYHLKGKNSLSHCAVLDIPGYHKLLNFSDGGMVVKPDQEQKFEILENAILVCRALNLSPVKIAVSGHSEKVTEKNKHTIEDNENLIPRAKKEIDNIEIQGPLPLDTATSKKFTNLSGAVIGDADIYLVDSIEECNIITKSLIQFIHAVFAGVIVGAKVPVSLVSRTDTVKNKKASLAIACVISDYYSTNNIWGDN